MLVCNFLQENHRYGSLILWNINVFTIFCHIAPYAGINLTGYHPPRADRRATNFFRQNPRPGDSFSVQNSRPRVEKPKQNPHPRA